MNLGVSLEDYKQASGAFAGNANVTQEDLAELSKALEAGSITGRETTDLTTASGAPLKVESLENTLKIITFKESDIQLWKRIPKLPAYNTVEEYNQLASYGTSDGLFNNEGELPREDDSIYIRKAQIVKYMGVTGSVSHPMQLVRTNIGSAMAQEVKNRTLQLLRAANRNLVYSDSEVVPQEWNGLYAQQRQSFTTLQQYMDSEVIIDLRGKSLREADIELGCLTIIENFGYANLLMAPPVVLSDFVKAFYDAKFIQPNTPALTAGVMGQRVQKFQSQYGEIELGYDIFLNAKPSRRTTSGPTSTSAPGTPTGPVVAPVADGSTKFNDATQAGDYFYAVAAKNRFGESALLPLAGALVSVAVGEAVDLTFVAAGGANPATGFVIYRSKKNPTTALADTPLYPLFEVSLASQAAGYDGGVAGVVRDRNRFIADTQQAFLLQADTEVYSFKQLAPLMKMDLAVLSPASRFMILMYGTPMLYAQRKMVRYVNIGRDLS